LREKKPGFSLSIPKKVPDERDKSQDGRLMTVGRPIGYHSNQQLGGNRSKRVPNWIGLGLGGLLALAVLALIAAFL
jgi:hypothetical protein